MSEVKNDLTVIQDSQKLEENPKGLKNPYVAPKCESHNPLEIMSAWQDKSSELVF